MKIERHNEYHELSEVFKKHFKMRETDNNRYFKLVPTGNFELFDYNRGLCWITASILHRPENSYPTIRVNIGNVDDGMWAAETEEIQDGDNLDRYIKQVSQAIDGLHSLPPSNELSIILSVAVNPYLLSGEFE
jgi:hypothetical protein